MISRRPRLAPPALASGVLCAHTPAGPQPAAPKPARGDGDAADELDDALGDEPFGADDDSDLGLSEQDDEDEDIGLDTALGFEDTNEDLEVPDDGEDDRENEHWSTDSEEVGDIPGTDTDLFQGEEYGWTGDDEPNDDDDEAFDAELDDEERAPRDDEGAEGLEDDSELDELDMSELPAMDADAEEEANGNSVEGFEELAAAGMVDEPTLEVAPGEFWKALPARSVRVSTLSTLPTPATALATCNGRLFVCAGEVFVLEVQRAVLQPLPPAAAGASALALAEYEGVVHVAVIVGGRVLVSNNGGRSFAAHEVTEPAIALGFTRTSQRPRLWWLNARGVLRNLTASAEIEGEVIRFHAAGARQLVALVCSHGQLAIAFSTDAGKSFSLHAAPERAAEANARLEVCRGALLCASGAGVQCAVPPAAFASVSALVSGPAALSDEDGQAFVYATVQRGNEWLIVRRAAQAVGRPPTVVASFAAELAGAPRQLAVSYADGGFVSIFVATDSSLLRVDASLDGEELA